MTVRDVQAMLATHPPDALVAVAGHGRLAFLTHAHTTEGDLVVVLYVQAPEPVRDPVAASGPEDVPLPGLLEEGTS